jgi:hypothetical protein
MDNAPAPLSTTYGLTETFRAAEVLRAVRSHHGRPEKPAYVVLTLRQEGAHRIEGRLVDIHGATALLEVGKSEQFVDLNEVVAVTVQDK